MTVYLRLFLVHMSALSHADAGFKNKRPMRREKIKVSFSLKRPLRAHEVCSQHLEPGKASRARSKRDGEANGSASAAAARPFAGQSYPVFATGVFEGAEDERAAAVVLHVVSQILSGDVGRPALVWTLDREARAVVLVVLQRITQHRGGGELMCE